MLLGIDHVVIACHDPDDAAALIERQLGLEAAAGGRHEALGTANRIVWLGDSYVELVGIADVAVARRSWLGRPVLAALGDADGGLVTWAVAVDDLDEPTRGVGRGGRHVDHALEEEPHPLLPLAVRAHALQALVVLVPVALEVQAQVEQRPRQYACLRAEQERDEQAAEAAVTVEERMDRLELRVRQRRLQEDRRLRRLIVEEALEVAHRRNDVAWRRRNEARVAGPRAADPVLRRAELARGHVATTSVGHEHPVDLAQQPARERKAAFDTREPVRHRLHVVERLGDLSSWNARRVLVLE
jgi:hypothetical protein